MRQLNQLPRRAGAPAPELSERGTSVMWVSGSDKQHAGKILGVIAFFRSEGNDQRER